MTIFFCSQLDRTCLLKSAYSKGKWSLIFVSLLVLFKWGRIPERPMYSREVSELYHSKTGFIQRQIMSCVYAISHPIGITVGRLSIPAQEFNRCVAKADVGPQLLLHDVFRYDHGDALLASVCEEIWICSIGREMVCFCGTALILGELAIWSPQACLCRVAFIVWTNYKHNTPNSTHKEELEHGHV